MDLSEPVKVKSIGVDTITKGVAMAFRHRFLLWGINRFGRVVHQGSD